MRVAVMVMQVRECVSVLGLISMCECACVCVLKRSLHARGSCAHNHVDLVPNAQRATTPD